MKRTCQLALLFSLTMLLPVFAQQGKKTQPKRYVMPAAPDGVTIKLGENKGDIQVYFVLIFSWQRFVRRGRLAECFGPYEPLSAIGPATRPPSRPTLPQRVLQEKIGQK